MRNLISQSSHPFLHILFVCWWVVRFSLFRRFLLFKRYFITGKMQIFVVNAIQEGRNVKVANDMGNRQIQIIRRLVGFGGFKKNFFFLIILQSVLLVKNVQILLHFCLEAFMQLAWLV